MNRLAFLLVLLTLAGCAAGPDAGESQKVATSSMINGVEVWTGGTPPRSYQVIATVARQAADNSITYEQQEASIALEARSRGADAVIVLDEVMGVSRIDIASGRSILAPKVAAQLIKYQ